MSEPNIPVSRPLLPTADKLLPYLNRIDRSRRYSNQGDLVDLLGDRLSGTFALSPGHTVCAASGTAALAGAVLATAGRASPDKPFCLCPGYTFVATPMAAEVCGYRVHLVDVDPSTWAVDADALSHHPLLDRTGVVVVTAPYGRSFSQAAWQRFRERTSIPVVIDGAASIEALADGRGVPAGLIPVVISLHATKAFGVGEGGIVVGTEPGVLRATHAALNYGFDDIRASSGPGLNGKMSEYHAAVGLAELDGWGGKRSGFAAAARAYRRLAAPLGLRIHTAPEVSSCYVLLETASVEEANATVEALTRSGVGCRHWYGLGLHREPYFRDACRDSLPVVEDLAPRLLGLPVAPDLDEAAVARTLAVLGRSGLTSSARIRVDL